MSRKEGSFAIAPQKGPLRRDVAERFWEKVDRSGECWEWMSQRNKGGYGLFRLNNPRRKVRAHRLSYELLVGPIPEGLELDHLCRNHACVRPDHLEAVTHRINILRGEAPPARCAKVTHCPKGHVYDEANTLIEKGGKRKCRICQRNRARAKGQRR